MLQHLGLLEEERLRLLCMVRPLLETTVRLHQVSLVLLEWQQLPSSRAGSQMQYLHLSSVSWCHLYGCFHYLILRIEADQETWLLDVSIRRPGLCVKLKPRIGGGFDWHNGDYDGAEGVLVGMMQLGSEYTSTAQVYITSSPNPELPSEASAVPIFHLAPIPPGAKGHLAIALDGELKGQKVLIMESDGDQLVITPADEVGGKIASARSGQLCKWVASWDTR